MPDWKPPRAPALLVATAVALAGCATVDDGYPSLAKRDAERVAGSAGTVAPAPPPPPAPPVSDALVDRLASLVATARDAQRQFEAQQGEATRTISAARGASRASDSWIAAQVALSRLKAAGNPAHVALAELDTIYARERLATTRDDEPVVDLAGEARDIVAAMVEQQDTVLTRLSASLVQ